MTIQYLLKHNSDNIDLVDYFFENLSNFNFSQQTPQKKLYLSNTSGVENIKGVFIRENVTLTKEEKRNYSTALVNDATFIANLQYFINLYGVNLENSIEIHINDQQFTAQKYIVLAYQKFYILE